MSVTASDINRAISVKYSDPQWRVWFEVSQSTGSFSGRRADAVVMNIWPSKGYQLNVFEVKVSRSDFRSEMNDLTKWRAVGKYADFFWLACPVGLVKADEAPEGWGLMELTKGGLRVKKQAPARDDPAPIDRGFAASLLRSGEDLTEAEIQKRVDERTSAELERIRAASKAGYDRSLAQLTNRTEAIEKWKKEFEALYGVPPNHYSLPSDMAARLKLAGQLDRGSFESLARQAKALASLIEDIRPEGTP